MVATWGGGGGQTSPPNAPKPGEARFFAVFFIFVSVFCVVVLALWQPQQQKQKPK